MAYVRITAKKVRKLRMNVRVRVINKATKGMAIGMLSYSYPLILNDDYKIIRTKNYSINLSLNDELIDNDFIFEHKQRIRKVKKKSIRLITEFL